MNKGKDFRNNAIYFCLIVFIFVYRIFIYKYLLKYNESITSSFSIILLSLAILMYGYRKPNNTMINKKAINLVLIGMLAYFVITYTVGLAVGFLANSYSLELTGIITNTFFVIITIIATEILRYVFIDYNKGNHKDLIFITIILILFEANLNIRYDSFGTFERTFRYISTTFLPIVMKNIMCSYITYKSNYKPCLVYRLVMDLYIYFLPIQPDMNYFWTSFSSLILPFTIFIILYNSKSETSKAKIKKSIWRIIDIPIIVVLCIFLLFAWGIGPFMIVGIETESMYPKIHIGDAVLIDKTIDRNILKEGDIIAYEKKDIIIVHRIFKKNGRTYITKGDNNNAVDAEFVDQDQIIGIVRIKIPFLAYPRILLK